jgi:hypothetical protein
VRFSLIHLDDEGISDTCWVVTPGVEKTVIAVPLQALDAFLPLLAEASRDLPEARCEVCEGDLLGEAR